MDHRGNELGAAKPISANYTTLLSDAGIVLLHPAADTSARTWTIDSNANVAYITGTCLIFVNAHSAGTLTIAITSDTLYFSSTGATGSRTLSADGVAVAIKTAATTWEITGSGSGLS